jgi:hypothetical protein
MSSIKSSLATTQKDSILDDKSFIAKFVFLIISIILVSIFGLMQDRFSFEKSSFSSLKLEVIEKSLNGNSVNLAVVENDFDNLEELDLSDIQLVDSKYSNNSNTNSHNKQNVKKITLKKSKQNKVLITSGNIKSLSFIKKKFYATNNIKFSLLIAEKFLENKRYKKALKWALISNEINDKNEKSWILFAKAKINMGKKQDAINALSAYLKNNSSTNVKNLLDDISKSS